ncbi:MULTISPECIES: hypothetical protein [unclassified Microcystis]|uniref:hypothetical protein n=1 Tax=unclassified Microcystis TaxID=2643300 RepID=UPI00257D7357|nr:MULTISPECIES: hypothetical protein [unclassified Microcystis]
MPKLPTKSGSETLEVKLEVELEVRLEVRLEVGLEVRLEVELEVGLEVGLEAALEVKLEVEPEFSLLPLFDLSSFGFFFPSVSSPIASKKSTSLKSTFKSSRES